MEISKTYQTHHDDEIEQQLYKVDFEFNQVFIDTIQYILVCLFLCLVGVGIIMLPFAILVFFYAKTVYENRRCYITTTNVVLKQELPNLVCCLNSYIEQHAQLHNIVDVVVHQSWLQRQFGCFTVHIQNPGQTAVPGQGGDVILHGVKNAHEVKRMLLDMSSKLKSGDTSMGVAILPSVTNSSFELGSSRTNNINQEYFNIVVDISQSLKRIEHLLASQQNQNVTNNYQNLAL